MPRCFKKIMVYFPVKQTAKNSYLWGLNLGLPSNGTLKSVEKKRLLYLKEIRRIYMYFK